LRPRDSARIYHSETADTFVGTAWLDSEDLRYLVGWSPIQQLPESREAMIDMSAFSSFEYSGPMPITLDSLRVHLVNRGGETSLRMTPISEDDVPLDAEIVSMKIPRGWSGWVSLPSGVSGKTKRFRLSVGGAVLLKGVTFGDSKLNWPWEQRATLSFQGHGQGSSQSIRFDPDELFPVRGWPVSARILSDSGSTVLAELMRYPSNRGPNE
jgi:hypothetical protein